MTFKKLKVVVLFLFAFCERGRSEALSVCYVPWLGNGAGSSKIELGPDYEAVKDFIERYQYKAHFSEARYTDLLNKVDNKSEASGATQKNCDLFAASLTLTPERARLNIIPLYSGRTFVVSRRERKISSVDELYGLKTVVVRGTTYGNILNNLSKRRGEKQNINIQIEDKGGNVEKLLNKSVDFILADAGIAFALLKRHSAQIRLGPPVGPVEQIGWAVAPQKVKLAKQVQDYFRSGKDNSKSTVNDIYRKYFGLSLADYELTILSASR
jgi:hypothetical protein